MSTRSERIPADTLTWGELLSGLLLAAVGAGATYLAATPWIRAFDVSGRTTILAVAATVPVLPAVFVGHVMRRPPWLSYAFSLLGLVVALLVFGGADRSAIVSGLVSGPTRLLTETLPLTGPRAVFSAALAVTWCCGAVTGEVLVRSRSRLAGLAVPLVCFAGVYALTSSAPGADTSAGPILLAVSAVGALVCYRLREDRRRVVVVGTQDATAQGGGRRPRRGRGLAIGGVAAVVVAAVAGWGIPRLPAMHHHRTSLGRSARTEASLVVDPVDVMASLRDMDPGAPAQKLLRLESNRPFSGYITMAVLDGYNGATWSFNSTFKPTGERIPPAPADAPGVAGSPELSSVTQHYVLSRRLPLPMLPELDRPLQVHGLAVDADRATGMVATSQASRVRRAYTVVSRALPMTLGGLPPADRIGVVAGQLPSRLQRAETALPKGSSSDVADALRFLSTLTGRRPAPTLGYLQAVAAALETREHRLQDSSEPVPGSLPSEQGGTSLAEVINAVTVNQAATPEQFATFFAMVARYLGVPARVVTGFRLPGAGSGSSSPIRPGRYEITNREAWTWAEIPVAGLGWVVADPTPSATSAGAAPPAERVQAAGIPPKTHHANAVPRNELGGHAVAPRAHVRTAVRTRPSPWLLLLGVVAALLVGLAAFGPGLSALRRVLRRRARRRGAPAEQVAGAWLELLDTFDRAGLAVAASATSSEVTALAGQGFGPEITDSVHELGVLADRAVCSVKHAPGPEEARDAWAAQRVVHRYVRSSLSAGQRARSLLFVGRAPARPASRKSRDPSSERRGRGFAAAE